jgi:hypothetical protein
MAPSISNFGGGTDDLVACAACGKQPQLSRLPPKESVGAGGDFLIECDCADKYCLFVNYARTEAVSQWNTKLAATLPFVPAAVAEPAAAIRSAA